MRKNSAWLNLSVIVCSVFLFVSCKKTIATSEENTASYATVSSNLVDASEVVGNFETIWQNQWHTLAAKSIPAQYLMGNRSQIPVREGNYAGRFIVRPGDRAADGSSDERCEIGHYNDTYHGYSQEKPGDDYYYGWSTYIPTNWVTPPTFCIFAQWHHRSFSLPPIAFNIGTNTIGVQLFTGLLNKLASNWPKNYSYNAAFTLINNPAKGVWHDFLVRIKFSPGNDGILQVYHKLQSQSGFAMIFNKTGIPTMQMYRPQDWASIDNDNSPNAPDNKLYYGGNITTQAWCRIGLYRASGATFTNTIYHDNWARGKWWSAIANNF